MSVLNTVGDAATGAPDQQALRQEADARLHTARPQPSAAWGDSTRPDTEVLLHDLQVHQIELEMQNQELRQARDALDVSRARYVELYDLAPVGYCSVNKAGLIVQANLTLATLLNVSRRALHGCPLFSNYVMRADQDRWYRLRTALFADSHTPQRVELRLRLAKGAGCGSAESDAEGLWVQLAATPAQDCEGQPVLNLAVSDISDSQQAKAALAESEARLRTVVESTREAIVVHRDGRVIFVNPAAVTMIGAADARDLLGKAVLDFVHPDCRATVQQRIERQLKSGEPVPMMEEKFIRLDGLVIDVEVRARPVLYQGQAALQASISDVTERKRALTRLQLAASVFEHAFEGIIIADCQACIVDVNLAFTRITGYKREEVMGQNPRLLKSGRQDRAFYAAMWSALTLQGHWSGEMWNRRKNGEIYAELLAVSAVRDGQGKVQRYVGLFSDITAIKEHQNALEHLAHFDALTNLPNRVLLADRLQQAMAQALRRGLLLAVVYLDLDGFKAVNDQYGHDVGDQLLAALANAMKAVLREGDTLARVGGDEFVVVLVDLESVASCLPMLNRLLEAAAEPVQLGERLLHSSASLGVTFYPQAQGIEGEQLLRQADQAMYQSKVAGKSCYHLFDAAQDHTIRSRRESQELISQALVRREFVLYYQPKVNMQSGKVTGAEALIRWQHPQRGLLAPACFLPEIEDHPLAVAMGEWVIDSALSQIERWRADGLDLAVSVNIGARQLQQSDFCARLQAILATHPQVNPTSLQLEILETSALADMEQVSQVIEVCAAMGVEFALDDFGTGYSSLTYLKRLRVAVLKIDQSFVRDMQDDPDDLAILQGVIGLAAAFKREVIAEGVETVAHGTALLQLDCQLAQGYGIARPMPAELMPAWAATWQPAPAWCELAWLGGALQSMDE